MAQRSNRQQLLDGAIECLTRQGYARTTARDIATASGANLASIGYHFGSKEALLNEAMITLFRRRNWTVATKADRVAPDRIRAYLRSAVRVFRAPRPLIGSFVDAIAQATHSEPLRSQLAEHYRDARRAVGTKVLELGDAPDRSDARADVAGTVMLAVFDGLAIQWLLDPGSVPSSDDLIDAFAVLSRPVGLEALR